MFLNAIRDINQDQERVSPIPNKRNMSKTIVVKVTPAGIRLLWPEVNHLVSVTTSSKFMFPRCVSVSIWHVPDQDLVHGDCYAVWRICLARNVGLHGQFAKLRGSTLT